MATVEIICAECGGRSTKPVCLVNRSIRRGIPPFCGRRCATLHHGKYPTPRPAPSATKTYPPRNLSIADRLAHSTIPEPNSGCLLWLGSISSAGYGRIRKGRQSLSTHRLAWIEANGPIPDGLFVCHKCDVRSCCNPQHMFVGTTSDNMADMVRKGRKGGGRPPNRPQSDEANSNPSGDPT